MLRITQDIAHWGECGVRLIKNNRRYVYFDEYRVGTLVKHEILQILFMTTKKSSEDWHIVYLA